jgi:riboflavin kinase/FMN adenylyltransferase
MKEVPFIGNVAITIGNFDGVHLGHVQIFRTLLSEHEKGLQSMVMTFWPHPRQVLTGKSDMRFLTSMEEKTSLLRTLGIQHLLIVPFDRSFAEIHAEDFIKNILIERIGVRKIFLGYDHHFGKNREGNIAFLKQFAPTYGFEVQEIPRQTIDHLAISSTLIRKYLEEGVPEAAHTLLGRNYSLSGVVVEGKKLGRTIGFPTANIEIPFKEKLIPKQGVYAIFVHVNGKKHKGMMNIGYRPTLDGHTLSLEAHIFDFSEPIYGQTISIEFVHYLREEQKFSSLDALKMQLQMDKQTSFLILHETK